MRSLVVVSVSLLLVVAVSVPVVVRRIEQTLSFRPPEDGPDAAWQLPPNVRQQWVETDDDLKLLLWRWQPTAPRRGSILYSHGNGGNILYMRGLAEHFAARGYEFNVWDYRGYGRSGGSLPRNEDAFYEDAARVFNAVGGKPFVWGQSLGTTVSVDLCSRKPCQALIVESGMSPRRWIGFHCGCMGSPDFALLPRRRCRACRRRCWWHMAPRIQRSALAMAKSFTGPRNSHAAFCVWKVQGIG
jgi:alpha-beta hydrolase superfamily lysophospholipase